MWKHLRQPRRAAVAPTERKRGFNLAHASSFLVVHSTSSPVARVARSIGAELGTRQASAEALRRGDERERRLEDSQLGVPLPPRTLL